MIDNTLFEDFTVKTGLKQGDVLSPLLFNIAQDKAVRMMNSESVKACGIVVNDHLEQILGFSDDLNILSQSLDGIISLTMALERTAAKVGLRINVKKKKPK